MTAKQQGAQRSHLRLKAAWRWLKANRPDVAEFIAREADAAVPRKNKRKGL